MIADRIERIQAALAEAGLDGWLFACFQQNDPISLQFLGLAGGRHLVTRRCYYLVPSQGEPRKLAHRLEPAMLDHLPGRKDTYLTWQEHRLAVFDLVKGIHRLAVQYSPGNVLPTVSRLDAGTADLLRAAGAELVSSADLVSQFAATWSAEQMAGHLRAATRLHEIVRGAFAQVGDALRAGRAIDERTVQLGILEAFARHGLVTDSDPIVGVNGHAADPHYQPAESGSAAIRPGDFLLVDLWAKEAAPKSVFADITWCGVCAASPSDRQRQVFEVVAGARDAALALVQDRYPGSQVAGYEVDDAARAHVVGAGFGSSFFHRTGHSIDTADHGQGANMDNLETHDVRLLLPMTGFSIEPGVYLPGDFGVRSEINVALTPDAAVVSGGEPQRELIAVLA